MSRVGKKPVLVPQGVTASVEGQTVKVKGAKGALSLVVPDEVVVKFDPKTGIKLDPKNDTTVSYTHLTLPTIYSV